MLGAARILTLVGGLCLAAVGLVAGAVGLLVAVLGPSVAALSTATVAIAFMALAGGLGAALAWHAWRATQGKPSAPFAPCRIWPWIVLYLCVIVIGQAILSSGVLPVVLFPPFHVAAAVVPAWIALTAVARGLGPVSTWRDIVLEVGSGALVSTTLAILVEGILVVGLLVALIGFLAIQPDGLESLQTWLGRFQDPGWMQDPSALAPLVKSPGIIALVLLVTAGLIPLIEEATKTVGVGLRSYRRPTLAQAFLWGVACGAGFAMAEALFNAASGLQSWGLAITLRVGATVLHCLTGGLMGIAWYYIISERRWRRAAGLYAASVGIHGLWNGLSIGVLVISLGAVGAVPGSAGSALGGMGAVGFVALLIILAAAMCVGLWRVTRAVRRRSPPDPDGSVTINAPLAEAVVPPEPAAYPPSRTEEPQANPGTDQDC